MRDRSSYRRKGHDVICVLRWNNSEYYVKTCRFTRKCSGQKPTVNTTMDKDAAKRFSSMESAEETARKIHAYCRPNDRYEAVPA